MSAYAIICRDAAFGLLNSARVYREIGNLQELRRLVEASRFYWRKYKDSWR